MNQLPPPAQRACHVGSTLDASKHRLPGGTTKQDQGEYLLSLEFLSRVQNIVLMQFFI